MTSALAFQTLGFFLFFMAVMSSGAILGSYRCGLVSRRELREFLRTLAFVAIVGVALYVPATEIWSFSRLAGIFLGLIYLAVGMLVSVAFSYCWLGLLKVGIPFIRRRRQKRNKGGLEAS